MSKKNLLTVEMGRFLFQIRSFTPLVLLVLFWLPFGRHPSHWSILSAVSVMLLGLAIRVWCVHHATAATRTRQDQTHPLCVTGPYAMTRNPLYVANILIYGSAAWLVTHHWGWTVLIGCIFSLQYFFIIRYEEQLCRSLFGHPYLEYVQSVSRWLPNVNRQQWKNVWHQGAEPWRIALFQERRGLLAILIALSMFWLKQRWIS